MPSGTTSPCSPRRAGRATSSTAAGRSTRAPREVVAIGLRCRSRAGAGSGCRSARGRRRARARRRRLRGRPRLRAGDAEPVVSALRDGKALAVASFLSAKRLGYPPGKAQRERLLGRVDALVARPTASPPRPPCASPATTRSSRWASTPSSSGRPRRSACRRVGAARAPARQGGDPDAPRAPDWRMLVLRTRPLAGRPYVPRELASRVSARTLRAGEPARR